MNRHTREERSTEAVGVFVNAEQLTQAADMLTSSGFSRSSMGLLAAQQTIEPVLQTHPAPAESTAEAVGESDAPETERVERDSLGGPTHAWVGGASIAGTTALGATAVASAAVLGGALVAAAAGAAVVGAVGAAMAGVIHQSDATYLEEQVDDGRLLLFVRTHGPEEERRASELMSDHGALDVKVLTVGSSS